MSTLYYAIGGNNGLAGNTDLSNNILGLNALGKRGSGAINNVAIGGNSCGGLATAATTGRDNVAIGTNALDVLTTGSYNIAVGSTALGNLTTGINNIGIGGNSCGGLATAATTGRDNVAVGMNALDVLTTGAYNIAVGSTALGNLTIGGNNIAIGTNALLKVTTGGYNTAIGHNAYALNDFSYSTAIGYNSQPTASNQIMLGTPAETVFCPGLFSVGALDAIYVYELDVSGIGNFSKGIFSPELVTDSIQYENSLSFSSLDSNNVATERMRIDICGNVGIGTTTPGKILDVSGDILINKMTVGLGGGSQPTNTAFGKNALKQNTTGFNNIAIGQNALTNSAVGNNNIVVGSNSSNVYNNNYCANWVNGELTDASWARVTSGYVDDPIGNNYGKMIFVAIAYDSSSNNTAFSLDGINWTRNNTASFNRWWIGITYGKVNDLSATDMTYYGKSIFVAVADGGSQRVMTSTDGNTWVARTAYADTTNVWFNIKYGLVNGIGTFVAVAYAGTNRVMTSTDGITWTGRTAYADTSNNLFGITYGQGRFVATSRYTSDNAYRTMTSIDGITWIGNPSANDTISWPAVTYGNGLFVAVSDTSANLSAVIMTSVDGYNWIQRYSPQTASYSPWYAITYGSISNQGLFVAVAGPVFEGKNNVMTSVDGINWTSRTAYADTSSNWVGIGYGVVNGTGRFVAVSFSSKSNTKAVMTSDIIIPTIPNIESNNTFIGYNTSVAYSTNNYLSWSKCVAPFSVTTPGLNSIAYGSVNGVDTFVGVLSTGTKRVAVSNDAQNWRLINVSGINGIDGTVQWRSVAYGNSRFVAVGYSGTTRAMTSVNGITWQNIGLLATLQTSSWTDIVYGNGKFVAVADNFTNGTQIRVMTSTDGSNNWLPAGTPTTDLSSNWTSITYGNGTYIAVAKSGSGNLVMKSADGSNNWTSVNVQRSPWIHITYGLVDTSGAFVAISDQNDNVMRSMDNGSTWTYVNNVYGFNGKTVSYVLINGAGTFVAVSYDLSNSYTSLNGIAWTKYNNGTANLGLGINTIANGYVNGRSTFVAGGDKGAVYTQEQNYSNSVAIGANAQITASNQIMLGTANETVVCPNDIDVGGQISIKSSNLIAVNSSVGNIKFVNGGTEVASISSCVNIYGINNNGDLRFFTRLDFVNYFERMRITREGNIGIGTTIPQKLLDVNGDALISGLTIGKGGGSDSNSTAVGYAALSAISTGNGNTAIGRACLNTNTTGIENTAVGLNSLAVNTTGNYNTAIGTGSLEANTTATNNTAVGRKALYKTKTGSNNTAVGYEALVANIGGHSNIAIGTNALLINTEGAHNVAIGLDSLKNNILGSNNSALGFGAFSASGLSNSTAIGAGANPTASSQIMLGTASEQVYCPGTLYVVGQVSAASFNVTSDYRIKQNIESLFDISYTIDNLQPIKYFNTRIEKDDMGFIAHEVQDHFPFLVHGEKDGKDMQSINYTGLIALLVKEVQELKQSNKELKQTNKELKQTNTTLNQTNTVLQQQNETFENRLQRLESLLLNQ